MHQERIHITFEIGLCLKALPAFFLVGVGVIIIGTTKRVLTANVVNRPPNFATLSDTERRDGPSSGNFSIKCTADSWC